MGINLVQRILLRFTLFFCWFISFAAYNFESSNWGLQVGWIFAFLFCLAYSPKLVTSNTHFLRERQFVAGRRLFLVIFSLTATALFLIAAGAIRLPEAEMLVRTVGHSGYLMFYAWVYLNVYHALRQDSRRYWNHFRWFFIYPFAFIASWGIYQNLTTYGIAGEYLEIFNNSASTGFTYERFRDAHRVSSVFPEPSEYSYYLALLGPIVWACFRNQIPWNGKPGLGFVLVGLWVVQAAMVKSLSFLMAIPVVLYVCLRHVEGWRLSLKLILSFACVSTVMAPLAAIGLTERFAETLAGDDGSVLARYDGLMEALDLFMRSPLVGFGYGVVRGLDALSFTLASFGVLGTLALWIALRQFFRTVQQRSTPILSGALVCLVAGCILSNNVLDHMFIWVLIAVVAACPLVHRPTRRSLEPMNRTPLLIGPP